MKVKGDKCMNNSYRLNTMFDYIPSLLSCIVIEVLQGWKGGCMYIVILARELLIYLSVLKTKSSKNAKDMHSAVPAPELEL